MPTPPRPRETPTDPLPPGAERFWGQFSQTKAGRTSAEEEAAGEGHNEGQESAGSGADSGNQCLEWCPICRSAELLRLSTSPDAIHQVQAIQHEAVNVIRSLVTAYAEKVGEAAREQAGAKAEPAAETNQPDEAGPGGGPEPGGVRDISID
jgi:hypothetical protein